MISSTPSALSSRIPRLSALCLIILGAVAGASAAAVTNGTIVYNASPALSVTGATSAGLYFDLDNDGTNDFFIQNIFRMGGFAPSPDFLTSFVSNGKEFNVPSTGFAVGDTIGPNTVFLGTEGGTANAATIVKTNNSYYGFSFITGGTQVYGWMYFGFSSATGPTTKLTMLGWAYETSGAPITVGSTSSASAVPEVSTSTLLMGSAALLAGSVAAWRRRKARVQTAV